MVHTLNASAKLSLHCAFVAAAAVTLGGCSAATERNGTPEAVAHPHSLSHSQVGEPIGYYHDFFYRVETVLAQCDWVGPSDMPAEQCYVPEGYVAVGGGVEVQGENGEMLGTPGAMLVSSFPAFPNFFVGASKEHLDWYPHKLRAYVIGMRIQDSSGNWLSAAQLRSQMYVVSHATFVPDGGAAAALVNLSSAPEYQPGDLLVGGGAAQGFDISDAGRLLYGSQPFGDTSHPAGWIGWSKDHEIASPGTVVAFAVGMRACPAGANRCFSSQYTSVGASAASTYDNGYSYTLLGGDASLFALTSIGGVSGWSGAGRLLTHMIPRADDVFAEIRSKDHHFFDNSGNLTAYGLTVTCDTGQSPTPCFVP